MPDLWNNMDARMQDALILLGILAPALILGGIICRGFALRFLLISLLRRYLWTNIAFVILVALSVGLGVGLIAQERGLRQATARVSDKFDLIITAPGDKISMLMATVYLQATDAPLLDGNIWQQVSEAAGEGMASPIAYGDSWHGHPIIGSTAPFITHLAEELTEGQMFTTAWQAIAGARVPVAVGDHISPAHGHGETAEEHAHDHIEIVVSGRMAATGSPWDDAIIVPVESVWLTHGLGNGHADGEDDRIGPPFDPQYFPGSPAILVATPDLSAAYGLQKQFSNDQTMAFFPGSVLSRLHSLMGNIRDIMSFISLTTQVLVATAVMAGLIVLSRLFARKLALLQALGAPSRTIFALVWSYAATLIGTGSVLGLGVGLLAVKILSTVISTRTGLLVTPMLGWSELQLIAVYFTLTMVVALLPAALSLTRPVAEELKG